jgi:hypothetical protein
LQIVFDEQDSHDGWRNTRKAEMIGSFKGGRDFHHS